MHPIKQLQQLLTKRRLPSSGTVIKSEGSSIYVATEQGMQSVTRSESDVTAYGVGDSVQFANGQVFGRRRPPKTIYVR